MKQKKLRERDKKKENLLGIVLALALFAVCVYICACVPANS